MNAITRRLATLVAALALAVTAAGCANTPTATPTADTADSQATLDAINNAREIAATKSLLSWGDSCRRVVLVSSPIFCYDKHNVGK